MKNNQKIDIVLLCGGKGSRFHDVTKDATPKSLYTVKDKELILYTLDSLNYDLVGHLIFSVNHHADQMSSWVQRQNFPIPAIIVDQKEPGIIGAVKAAGSHIASPYFVLCNTDEIRLGFDFDNFIERCLPHMNGNNAMMATCLGANLVRHRVVDTLPDGKIANTYLKNDLLSKSTDKRMINIGFLALPTRITTMLDTQHGNGWSSIIDPLVNTKRMYSIFDHKISYFNVGTDEELKKTIEFLTAKKDLPQT